MPSNSTSSPKFKSEIVVSINNGIHTLEVTHNWTLLYLLREILNLTGSKDGCDKGECGSCTVLMNDAPVYACQILAIRTHEKKITTIEGLMTNDRLHPIQKAFIEEDSGQCGYCTPGFVMSAYSLLERNPAPTEEEVRSALIGNLCRCNAYGRIIEGVMTAARGMKEGLK